MTSANVSPQEEAMAKGVEIAPHIWQVWLPAPFPLQRVYAYVFRGREGIDILDTGLHDAATIAAWERARHLISFAWTDVRRIVLTHHHPDHMGLAGWIQQRSGAVVWATPQTRAQMECFQADRHEAVWVRTLRSFVDHGWPQDRTEEMKQHLLSFVPQVHPLPTAWAHLEEGMPAFSLGKDTYEVIDTPGHAVGHVSFWDPQTERMFCGDHVLQDITPNVAWTPYGEQDPLHAYFTSLQRMQRWRVSCAYAGHRGPIHAYGKRIDEIIHHHQNRLARIEEYVIHTPMDAYTCCQRLFPRALTVHQWRFAMGEVLAHLVYLERSGRIVREEASDSVRFGV